MEKSGMEKVKRKAKALGSIAEESDKKAALMPPGMKDDAAILHKTAEIIRTRAAHLFPVQVGAVVKTYTLRLCKNGKEFMVMQDVADLVRPVVVGETIDGKWRVRGVISHTVSEIVVDVEAADL
jgi:hypothetical protein